MNKKLVLLLTISLLIIWGTFFFFVYRYAEVLKKNPCSVCAENMGSEVSCTTRGITRIFYENGSYEDIYHTVNVKEYGLDINVTELEEMFRG